MIFITLSPCAGLLQGRPLDDWALIDSHTEGCVGKASLLTANIFNPYPLRCVCVRGCEEVVKMVARINRMLLLVRDLSRETSVRWHHKLSCVMFVKCIWNVSTFSCLYKQSAATAQPPCIFCDETARLHEVISPLPKWDGNAFTQGIQQHAAAPRRRQCNSNGTNNRASVLLTRNLYCTLQKWDQLYGSVGFLWEEKKEIEKEQKKICSADNRSEECSS